VPVVKLVGDILSDNLGKFSPGVDGGAEGGVVALSRFLCLAWFLVVGLLVADLECPSFRYTLADEEEPGGGGGVRVWGKIWAQGRNVHNIIINKCLL